MEDKVVIICISAQLNGHELQIRAKPLRKASLQKAIYDNHIDQPDTDKIEVVCCSTFYNSMDSRLRKLEVSFLVAIWKTEKKRN